MSDEVTTVTPFVLGDLGAADAGNSLQLYRQVQQTLEKSEEASTPRALVLLVADRPQNDWEIVKKNLESLEGFTVSINAATGTWVFTSECRYLYITTSPK